MNDQTMREDDSWRGARSEGPGSRIGPFVLLRRIGEGGFGDIFEAEQEEPVRRRVALKIIKLGMSTREVIARFDVERQALAMMSHPHIARVFDAGETESGRPYFVMELVEGEPISEYCDANRLSIEARLRLFEQVCAAVQHAHTKGVIHRDLKPSNVLVGTHDGAPVAKVIDFGIAKAIKGQLTEKTLVTELHQVMGTPAYMSPEQVSASADIDTRTDIYALGVILYELLTGTTPFDAAALRSESLTQIQKIICEVEPPRPSERLAQSSRAVPNTAFCRSTDSGRLMRSVEGELDWIVMKALEKERTRRYETANGLAMDVRRHLAAEPVIAAPPSASYRFRKFVRRHKGIVGAGSLIAISLLAGIGGFAWQAHIAMEQERVAQQRADELEKVSRFQASILEQIDPVKAGESLDEVVRRQFGIALAAKGLGDSERTATADEFAKLWRLVNTADTAREMIDRSMLKPAEAAIQKQFGDQPLIAATLMQGLSNSYGGTQQFELALPLAEKALATRKSLLGNDAVATLESLESVASALFAVGKLNESESYFRDALAMRRRTQGENSPATIETMRALGEVLEEEGKDHEAEPYLREVLARRRRVLGNANPATIDSTGELGVLLNEEGKFAESEPYYREALENSRRFLGKDAPQTLIALNNLGLWLQFQGKEHDAEPYLLESLDRSRRVLGNDHPDTLTSIGNVAVLMLEEGKFAEAERYQREALAKRQKVLGDDAPDTLLSLAGVGEALLMQQKLAEAERFLREALKSDRRVLGEDHMYTLGVIRDMGWLLVEEKRFVEAATLLSASEKAARKVFAGGNANRLGSFLKYLGLAHAGAGQYPLAETELLEARKLERGKQGVQANSCSKELADMYAAWDRADPQKGHAAQAAACSKAIGRS